MKKILLSQLKNADYQRTAYRINVDGSIKDYQNPEAFVHICHRLKRYDRVELMANDGTWYAEGIVTSVKEASVSVHFFTIADLVGEDIQTEEGAYKVEHSAATKWRIIRNSDKEVMQADIQSKKEALRIVKELSQE